jgi:hypothetical protein
MCTSKSKLTAEEQELLAKSLINLEAAYHSPNGSGYAMIHIRHRTVHEGAGMITTNPDHKTD